MTYLVAAAAGAVILAVLIMIKPRCPRCGGKLHSTFFDLTFDKLVYKCSKCGEEYI